MREAKIKVWTLAYLAVMAGIVLGVSDVPWLKLAALLVAAVCVMGAAEIADRGSR